MILAILILADPGLCGIGSYGVTGDEGAITALSSDSVPYIGSISPSAMVPGDDSSGKDILDPSAKGSADASINAGSGLSGSGLSGSGGSLQGPSSYVSLPQVGGPYQDSFTPEVLGLEQPAPESFDPDSNLDFVAAQPPIGAFQEGASAQGGQLSSGFNSPGINVGLYGLGQEQTQRQAAGSIWFYPGSLKSNNRLYIQTSSGFRTTGGVHYRGYLPIWADIRNAGNFFSFEWYPGSRSPSIRYFGWSTPGYKRGWFSGDVPGWHILCYNSNGWSNYIYIYVWPMGYGSSGGASYAAGQQQADVSQQYAIPAGAPNPPNPQAEDLKMPDLSLLGGSQKSAVSSGEGYGGVAAYGPGFSGQMSLPDSTSFQGTCSNPSECSAKGAVPTPSGAVYSPVPTYPARSSCDCAGQSSCPCNGYYIQVWPNKLTTAAGVRFGEWLPLWSKIGKAGPYWSYEWSPCSAFPRGYYCHPDIKYFGWKQAGWSWSRFYGNAEGWHILAYNTGQWSNYIYIYVWPYN